jgi:uncharacterized membrane protein (DUF4010 family)
MIQIGPEVVPVDADVFNLFVAGALGMLLGLEREWSNKAAGIRTFTLTSLVGVAVATLGQTVLLAVGGLLVLGQGLLLGARGLVYDARGEDVDDDYGLALTTSTSLLVAYVVGILVGMDYVLVGVVIAITSSFLLVLRRELHGFAHQLSHSEVRGAAEFAIIAFVVYPLLPSGTYGPWDAIDPRLVWTLVIAVSGIGFANYAIMQRYGGRGMLITGFFGGLVNSTAVIGEIATRAKANDGILTLAVGLPLGLIALGGVALTAYGRNWDGDIDLDLESPFSSRNALTFGVLFLAVLVGTAAAQETFGTAGFLVTSFLSGLLSSGTTTATAVSLTSTGQITSTTAAQGVLAGTLASILVKIWLAAGINRNLLVPVSTRSAVLSGLGVAGVVVVQLL